MIVIIAPKLREPRHGLRRMVNNLTMPPAVLTPGPQAC
jgi:hypothetical protein